MLTLTVTACGGLPLSRPLSTSFDAGGGTIGRAETSQLVLADPDRLVSRLHARVECREGRWRLTQQGVNPVLVNGRPMQAGEETGLADGDLLQIGAYDMRAHIDEPMIESFDEPARMDDAGFGLPDTRDTDPLARFMAKRHPRHAAERDSGPLLEPVSAPNTHQDDNPLASLMRAKPEVPPPSLAGCGFGMDSAYTTPAASPIEAVPEEPRAPMSLRAAFARGAGMDEADVPEFTPEFAQRTGALLREALQGTVDMLVARQVIKQTIHARLTLIEPTNNNPLKYAANADAALRSVLGPPMRGYLSGSDALRDACNDLRAHQFGFLAGLRASIGGLFERFAPERLGAQLPPPSGMHALFSCLRDARRWRHFETLYARLVREAEEDFFTLFGKAFVSAYEEAVDKHKH